MAGTFTVPGYIGEMEDTEEGFVVLVHIPMNGPMAPYRDVYLVGCSTHGDAEARIRDLYPSEPNLRISAADRGRQESQIGT